MQAGTAAVKCAGQEKMEATSAPRLGKEGGPEELGATNVRFRMKRSLALPNAGLPRHR